MHDNKPARPLTRGSFLGAVAVAPLIFAACSPTPSSYSQTAAISGIGSWHLNIVNGVSLLKMRIPVSQRASNGNQFAMTPEQVKAFKASTIGQRVHFNIVRDAGTFDCSGQVTGDSGRGTVLAFYPNEAFAKALQSKLGNVSDADLLKLALFDINDKFVTQGLRSNGHTTVEQLVHQRLAEQYYASLHGS